MSPRWRSHPSRVSSTVTASPSTALASSELEQQRVCYPDIHRDSDPASVVVGVGPSPEPSARRRVARRRRGAQPRWSLPGSGRRCGPGRTHDRRHAEDHDRRQWIHRARRVERDRARSRDDPRGARGRVADRARRRAGEGRRRPPSPPPGPRTSPKPNGRSRWRPTCPTRMAGRSSAATPIRRRRTSAATWARLRQFANEQWTVVIYDMAQASARSAARRSR